MKAHLPELDAMVRAYPAGQRVRAFVPVKDIRGATDGERLTPGTELTITSSQRKGQGEVATGRIVQVAVLVEVTMPAEDAPAQITDGQAGLLDGEAA